MSFMGQKFFVLNVDTVWAHKGEMQNAAYIITLINKRSNLNCGFCGFFSPK